MGIIQQYFCKRNVYFSYCITVSCGNSFGREYRYQDRKIIKSNYQKYKAIAIQNDDSLLDRSNLEETVNSVWTNRVAFSYLVAGYLIGVLGDCTIDR